MDTWLWEMRISTFCADTAILIIYTHVVKVSRVWHLATPRTIQSMEFSRPEYWSGQPVPSPGDLPDPGTEPGSPALQADSLPTELSGKPTFTLLEIILSFQHLASGPLRHNFLLVWPTHLERRKESPNLVVTSSPVLILVMSVHSQMQALGAADPPSCPVQPAKCLF